MDEFEIIKHAFRQRAPFVHAFTCLSNGDDASIHAVPEGQEIAMSTDISMAGKHWPENFPLNDAACRAVNVAVSDLAAMGATPAWVWLGVMAASPGDADRMGQGVCMALSSIPMELAGGDTICSPVNALSVTVAGLLPKGSGMRRDAARAGQDIWLCGKAGFSAYGLQQWRQGKHEGKYMPYFRDVRPLLNEGTRLRELGVTCCIDVSDGLCADAGHVADASGAALYIWLEKVPGFSVLFQEVDEQEA
ncbi:MAG: thiamine-phosphate kinase, partial [Mariprofundaceae bacterium]|nr:thiamine-phosphate kinase [Mariprofundaceae bacterium]